MIKVIPIEIPFNINIIYNNQDKNFFYNVYKIFISETNNQIFNKIYLKYLKKHIFYHINQINRLNLRSNILLQDYINYLQQLGFIRYINYTYIWLHKNKYILLKININPIIKVIKIENYTKLIISQKILKNLFKDQIGLPKNYLHINDSIKKIDSWYKLKGFKWIKINLIKDYNSNAIHIKINEGKIISSLISCNCNMNIKIDIHKLNSKILNELMIKKGLILNLIILDKQIQRIKKIYLINNLQYQIIYKKDGVHINLEYKLNLNTNKYLYYEILYENKLDKNKKELFNYYSFYRFLEHKIIKTSLRLNLYINYFIVYLNKYMIYYFINLQVKYDIKYFFKIFIQLSQIKLNSYILFSFYMSYYNIYLNRQRLIFCYNFYVQQLKFFNFKQILHNTNLSILKIITKYKFNSFIMIKYKFNHIYYYYKKKYLIIYSYNQNLYKKTFKLTKFFNLNFITYNIKLNSILYTLSPKLKNKFISYLKYNFIIYHQKYKYYNENLRYLYSQAIKYKIKNNLRFKLLKKINNHIVIYLQSNFFNYYIKRIFLLESFFHKFSILKNDDPLYLFSKCQYTININKYQTFYLFLTNIIKYPEAMDNYFILNSMKQELNLKKNSRYGLGIQLNIPIKQIPYIRLEYIVKSEKNIYLFIDYRSI
uniref:POTRA domain-containing protein n=1 Tax=Antithamnionella ternifolia TaxID=207919 RepID=A0A4D6WJ86_9FLOR|nr:hypothetical protein [Antithamnionella ternifolia]